MFNGLDELFAEHVSLRNSPVVFAVFWKKPYESINMHESQTLLIGVVVSKKQPRNGSSHTKSEIWGASRGAMISALLVQLPLCSWPWWRRKLSSINNQNGREWAATRSL